MKQKEFKGNLTNLNEKEVKMVRHSFEDYLIYSTIGALTAKFLEVIFKIPIDNYWYASLIIGVIIGVLVLKRREIFR